MEQITRKIYKNNSNGQLLITAPKGIFNEGDEVVLQLSRTAYEILLDEKFSIDIYNDKETSEFIQYKLKQFWTDELGDILEHSYEAEGFYEGYEDLSQLGLEIDFKIIMTSNVAIDFNIKLLKYINSSSVNNKMIKSLTKFINKDWEEEFKKYLQNSIDILVK